MRIEKIEKCKDPNDEIADAFLDNFEGNDDEFIYDIYYDKEMDCVVAEIWNEEDEAEENFWLLKVTLKVPLYKHS